VSPAEQDFRRIAREAPSLPWNSFRGDSGANLVVNNPGSFRGNRRNRGGDDGRDESTGETDFANALRVDDFGNAALEVAP
jgi:hypothetical protein